MNPTNLSSRASSGGTFSFTTVNKIGIAVEMLTKPAKADNLFVDAIRYGPGLTITGTNTVPGDGWEEIAAIDEDPDNKYGVLQRRPGGYVLTGKLVFGDSAGTGSVDFTDNTNSTIFIADRANAFTEDEVGFGGTYEPDVGIEIVGNGTGTTDFQLGNLLGSGDDRQGVLGGTFFSVIDKMNFDAETDTSDIDSCNLYGVTFENAGVIQLSGSTTQEAIGCTFFNCRDVQPNNAEFLNNRIIAPESGVELVSSHAIKQIDFIAGPTAGQPADAVMITSSDYINQVKEFNNTTTGDVDFIRSFAVNEYGSICYRNPFTRVTLNVSTARVGGTYAWEYYNGSSWSALPSLVDDTTGCSVTGTNDVSWDLPSDWAVIQQGWTPPLYAMRLRTVTSLTTEPILTQGFVKDIIEDHIRVPSAGTYSLTGLNFFGHPVAPGFPKWHVNNEANSTTADSYSDTNQDSTQALGNGTIVGIGQSITGNGGVLSRARFDLSKTLAPTGNVVAKVYAHSGTFGTSSVPTGAALATSENVDVSDLTTTLTLTDFEFKDEFTLVNTTKYVITLEYSGGDGSNYVNVGTDTSSPSHGGNFSTSTGTWSAVAGTDAVFFVYTGGIVKLNLSSSNATTYRNTGSPPGATIINNLTSVTLTGLQTNTEVRIYETGTTNEIDGVENSGTSFTFQADATEFVDIVVHHKEYIHIRIENYDVPNTDTTLPIEQEFDRNYNNP
jgi:hypothetical protein